MAVTTLNNSDLHSRTAMPALQSDNPASSPEFPTISPDLPAVVLDNLAARFGPEGLYLLMARPDGSIIQSDPTAAPFFQHCVLPMLQRCEAGRDGFRERIGRLTPSETPVIWEPVPGILLAAIPHVEKRRVQGVFLMAAKGETFGLGEDVVRLCSRLGIDGLWLDRQAAQLPAFDKQTFQRRARLLLIAARDQVRLIGMEREIDSLSGQLANTYEELSLIYQISGGMKINRRASDFFKQACLDVMEVINVRGMGVALYGEKFSGQEPALYGPMSLSPDTVHRLSDELMEVLGRRKNPLLINDLAGDKTFAWLSRFARQLLAVPLQRQDQVLGCLFCLDKSTGDFDSIDSKLLNSIANESAIYLENATLFEDVHELMMGLLHSLTSAVDAKDTYTCGHSERVAMLARHLARQAKLSAHQIERIYMAGLLHDVGKIGVPESVLQKTGRLTPEEFDQMKKHPEIGAKILQDIKQVKDIIPGVLYHHERYDGKGYPARLSGEDIPLMGRILCLADSFDAMTSNRTYRNALQLEVALAEIRRCSGTQFDPNLTEIFLQISADEFRDLLRGHSEQSKNRTHLQQVLRGE